MINISDLNAGNSRKFSCLVPARCSHSTCQICLVPLIFKNDKKSANPPFSYAAKSPSNSTVCRAFFSTRKIVVKPNHAICSACDGCHPGLWKPKNEMVRRFVRPDNNGDGISVQVLINVLTIVSKFGKYYEDQLSSLDTHQP